MWRKHFKHALFAGIVVALGGCGDGTTGQIAIKLTDAPNPMIQSATVWIRSVYLVGGESEAGPRYTITDQPQTYDLLTLTGGVTALLGDATIPTGDYTQLRLVVDSARVTLVDGATFGDGTSSRTMTTPSGQQTGIKVNFSGPVHVSPGRTVLVVDFDVARNFVFTGPSDAPTGVSFKPVLHASVEDLSGSIAGTVTPANDHAFVYAIVGTDTVTSAFADTTTGAYKLWYLPAATYTVAVKGTTLNASKTVTLAVNQDTTGVNFP